MEHEEWLPFMEACKQYKISIHVLRRLIREGKVEEKENIRDKREKLVNVSQLREVLKDS